MSAAATATAAADRRQRVVVATAGEFPVGSRAIVKVGGREIGVFHTAAGLFALRNSCPHQAAPLCLGTVTGTTLPSKPGEYVWGMEGRVLRCPWHGWEFDLETGVGLYDPYRHERVATYQVAIEGTDVVLYA
jgi:3-phenylpropionate/trans-cinnamate dioxygenase ferredoxin subunit